MTVFDGKWGSESLTRLLSPTLPETFFASYWQKEHLLVRRHDFAFHHSLLTLADIDSLLWSTALPGTQVNVGKDAVGVPQENFTNGGGYIDPARLLRLHREGNTIILRAMHLWLPKLRDLCEHLEWLFHAEAQANLYLTPPQTQSSYPHWDAHDIFVIQITGRKRWLLYDSPLKQPLHTFEFNPARHKIGGQTGEITVEAGDTAYLPRGLAHNPRAEEYSVHVALGVKVRTWADMLAVMFEQLALDHLACRDALPIAFGRNCFNIDECLHRFPEIAEVIHDPARARAALQRLSRDLRRSQRGDMRGMLNEFAAGNELTLESVVELPAGRYAALEMGEANCDATLNGIEIRLNTALRPAIEFIINRRRFCIAEIPARDDAARLALISKLIYEGCLTLAKTAD